MPATQHRLTDDGMSLGEVARLIEALRSDTTGRFDRIDTRLDGYEDTFLRKETYTLYTAGLERRVEKLEGTLQWVLRAFGGAFIAGVVTALVAAAKWL